MSTVVGIMDGPTWWDNTDVLVLADPKARRLTWIPRDLWCPQLGDRVNRAYALGGAEGLRRALAEHGLAVDHTLVLLRDASKAFIDSLEVTVPVDREEDWRYPEQPYPPVEGGWWKAVRFSPPAERLAGDRLHAWIGARYRVGGSGSDLDRISRQQRLLAVLMIEGTNFKPVLEGSGWRASSDQAVAELSEVQPGWRIETFGPLTPTEIEGRYVLVPG